MINFAVVDGMIILCNVVGVVVAVYGVGVCVGVNLILAIIVIWNNVAAVFLLVEVNYCLLQEFVRDSIRHQFRPPLSILKFNFDERDGYSVDIYCLSQKSWPILYYSKLLYEIVNYFLVI